MAEDYKIRFGVKDSDGKRSGIWRVWRNKDEVYFSIRSIAGALKFSLHSSHACRLAVTEQHIKKMQDQGLTHREDRTIFEYKRVPIVEGKVFQPVRIIIPFVSLAPMQNESSKEIKWIEAPSKDEATFINLLFSICPFESITNTEKLNLKLVGETRLPNGEWFLLISKNDVFDMEEFGKNNQNRRCSPNFLTGNRDFRGRSLRGLFFCPDEKNNLVNIVEGRGYSELNLND